MKLTKQQEKEVMPIYKEWWHSYLNGDVKTYNQYLDDDYRFVGSTVAEDFLNKLDTTKFFDSTAEQLSGKSQLRNSKLTTEYYDGIVFITELADAYLLFGDEWTFYGKFRFSSMLRKRSDGWRFIYQHFSVPDSKANEGETIGSEQVSKENQELKDAIKRRTVELENKNRELEIEAALERVRIRSMAMQSSNEFVEVSDVMISELNKIGINPLRIGLCTITSDSAEIWSRSENKEQINNRVLGVVPIGVHKVFDNMIKAWKNKKPYYTNNRAGDEVKEYYDALAPYLSYPKPKKYNKQETISAYFFAEGSINVVSLLPLRLDESKILVRFAEVFGQVYKRFLDLQKAEAQAREAEVGLALERVRSQALAMKESSDLLDIVVTMRNEFIRLGHEAHYFWQMMWLPDKYEKAMTSGDGTKIGMVMELPRHIHGDIPLIDNWEKSTEPTVVYAMDVEAALDYVDKMISLGDFQQIDPQAPSSDDIRHIGGLTFIMARTTHGEIGYSLPGVVKNPPAEDLNILIRLAGAFDFAHKRFLDLKRSEDQAREVEIELALEKVRSRSLAMHKSDELIEVADVLFQQLRNFGGDLWGSGIGLCFANKDEDEFSFANEKGILPAISIPHTKDPVHKRMYEGWKNKEVLAVETREGEELKSHYEYMTSLPTTKDVFQQILDSGLKFPKWQRWHAAYFSHGYLLLITTSPYEEEDLLIRFAKVFQQAYTRFLDLQKAETQALRAEQDLIEIKVARIKAEEALTELQSTQSQLIQSEKMASLGELTAGIAHEIQNPLNFVNNFSEVSGELIDEMNEELEKGDIAEAQEISKDVKENLEKILHHGKRADGIVKGMLQHSKSSSGTKEATDINALCDEYLRLAYHGLRAKDKSFNATMKTEFDENIEKINIVPQDIGRVILNLITNAFYAVSVKAQNLAPQHYTPTVSVSTKKEGDKIQISVKDNGNGIPDNIKEKIFQPFFTTKPTGKGTGLGLSLSYDIIKAHGGELQVVTNEGTDTEFLIRL